MDNPGYISITRLNGLIDEMRAVANNVANVSTTGFRAENLVFAEVLAGADVDGGALAMAAPRAHYTVETMGPMRATGGELDLAIDGEGYFQVQTPDGPRLTRAGAFLLNAEGAVVNGDGHQLLDAGGGPVVVPPGVAQILVGPDGALSGDGQPLAQLGVFTADQEQLLRQDGVLFAFEGDVEAAPEARIRQGYVEGSNVSPMLEMARLIEVQRAYQQGAAFLDNEHSRLLEAVRTLGRST